MTDHSDFIQKASEPNQNLRYERKFNAGILSHQEVVSLIKQHPFHFKEIFEVRQINNIYFDKGQLDFYHQNKIGASHRLKYRLRWYGNLITQGSDATLEVKIRKGQVGDKLSFPVKDLQIESFYQPNVVKETIQKTDLPPSVMEQFKSLSPVLLNSYTRRYFRSADGNFRITVDEKQAYYALVPFKKLVPYYGAPKEIIVELKYKREHDSFAHKISQHWPFRLSKSSKYVNGVDLIRHIQE